MLLAGFATSHGTVGDVSEHPTRPTAVPPSDRPHEPPQPRRPDEAAVHHASPSPDATPPRASNGGALERGTTIAGRYRLEAPIATGGMATVWRATDTVLTRPVAVKVLHAHLAADPEFVARFRREAVAAARLTHPSIVAIYDTSADPESIIMELVDGRTLRDELDARGFVPASEAVAIGSTICQALEVAHKAGIVHRDVKPANVLLSTDGGLKVADFGIAKAARGDAADDLPDLTAMGRMVGTAKYLAPEQVSGGEIDPRTDVYAVGAVLYEMLCGRAPFGGANDLAVATARLHGPPERPRSVLRTVPARLDEIVMKALALHPDERHPSASALWADLQSCPTEDAPMAPVAAGVDSTIIGDQPSFARSERSWLVPALLVCVVAGALGLAWGLIGGTEARRDLFDLVDRVTPGLGGGGGGSSVEDPVVLGATASAFDPPPGDGSEHDDEAPFAVDGDPATAWSTERYDSRLLGGLKDGVGLALSLERSVRLDELVLTSPNADWSATIHVADAPGASFTDWGEPVATISGAQPGELTVDLPDSEGSHVLVWLTDLGSGSGVQLELQEVVVLGR